MAGTWLAYDVKTEYDVVGVATAVRLEAPGMYAAGERGWALLEATDDLPILGAVDHRTGNMTAFGGQWDVLRLPISANATWETDVVLPSSVGDVAPTRLFLVARASSLPVGGPVTEQDEGYVVEGLDRAGNSRLHVAFSPRLDAVTRIEVFDEWAAVVWRAALADAGTSWDGATFTARANILVDEWTLVAPNTTDPASPFVEPAWQGRFTLSPDADTVYGYLVAYTLAGTAAIGLHAPDGTGDNALAAGADSLDVTVVDLPARPGEWRIAAVSVGAVAFAGMFLWEVTFEGTTT